MRVGRREFARIFFSTLISHMPRSNEDKSCMRVDESWQYCMVSESLHTVKLPNSHLLMLRSNWNKSYMRVDESWKARVYTRFFSTLMPLSNENKSFMRVDENWLACVGDTFVDSHLTSLNLMGVHENWRSKASKSVATLVTCNCHQLFIDS